MNERIKALAHEAGLPTYNPDGIPTKLEKFAELIVRECARIGNKAWKEDGEYTYIGDKIRKHFGVE